MVRYMVMAIDRVKALTEEYELARDTASRARIESRAADKDLAIRELERCNLDSLVMFWVDHPDTQFDDREVLESVHVALVNMRNAGSHK